MKYTLWKLALVMGLAAFGTALADGLEAKERIVFDFRTRQGKWLSVNDNVMGGISRGNSSVTKEGTLKFAGSLSLENNGGFASIRCAPQDLGLASGDGLVFRIKGDGRTYYANLHPSRRVTASSWRAPLRTEKGKWLEVRVPFKTFVWTVFGRRVPISSLDPAKVRSIGFTIADKKAGPFVIEIDWIKGYRSAGDQTPDLMQRIQAEKSLTTFGKALQTSGLAGALSRDTPVTVFAPTNDAFGKLKKGTLAELLRPENKVRLTTILLAHIAPDVVLLRKRATTMLQGETLTVSAKGPMLVGNAKVVQADVTAVNGVLHTIDTVLAPAKSDVGTKAGVARMIDQAVAKGVPLFNAGNPEVCAAIYEVALHRVMDSRVPSLSAELRKDLRSSAMAGASQKDATTRAWTFRRALDAARRAMR